MDLSVVHTLLVQLSNRLDGNLIRRGTCTFVRTSSREFEANKLFYYINYLNLFKTQLRKAGRP